MAYEGWGRGGGGGGGERVSGPSPQSDLQKTDELCESGVGRPGLSVLMSLVVSVDVKQY